MTEKREELLTDEELVIRTRNGDESAENELMGRYKSVARSSASSYFLAGGDPEDLMQEGMIGVFKAVRDYNMSKGTSFRTFAELCIKRQILSAVRGASRQKHQPLNESVSLSGPVNDPENGEGSTLEDILPGGLGSNPEDMLLMQEMLKKLKDNLARVLSEKEYAVWTMYARGCSYKEISLSQGISEKSVGNAVDRAKKKLSDLING